VKIQLTEKGEISFIISKNVTKQELLTHLEILSKKTNEESV